MMAPAPVLLALSMLGQVRDAVPSELITQAPFLPTESSAMMPPSRSAKFPIHLPKEPLPAIAALSQSSSRPSDGLRMEGRQRRRQANGSVSRSRR